MKRFILAVVAVSCFSLPAKEYGWTFAGADMEIASSRKLSPFEHPAKSFTFELTLCPKACPDMKGEAMVASWGNGYGNGWRLAMRRNRNTYRMSFTLGNADGKRRGVRLTGAVPADKWTTVAVVFNGSRVDLYRDGVWNSFAEKTEGFSKANPAALVLGGARHGLSFAPFVCSNVAVIDRALTAEEIAERYAKAVPEEKRAPQFLRLGADGDMASRRYAEAAGKYARLYREACAGKNPRRAEIAFAYAKALTENGKNDEAKAVLEEIAKADDLPAYLTREAASAAGVAPLHPEESFLSANRWKASERTECVFVVAPNGDDSAEGTLEKPLATLQEAVSRVRKYRRESGSWPKGGATIALRGGRYAAVSTVELDKDDSGCESAPLLIRSWPGETAILDGAREISSWRNPTKEESLRIAPAAQGKIKVADLPEAAFGELPPLEPYGYGKKGGKMIDLSADGKVLLPARHPNGNFAVVKESGDRTFGATFGSLEGWENEKNVFATGYWRNFWSDRTLRVEKIDPRDFSVTLAEGELPAPAKNGKKRIRKGAAVFLVNSLRALDTPGEWFLDREARKVYVWPENEKTKRWALNVFSSPFVSMNGTRFAVLSGIVFEGTASSAVTMNDVADVLVRNCTARNCGRSGIRASGRNIRVEGCVLHSLGRGGISISGGDRKKAERSGNIVTGCEAYDLGRHWRTYSPAVGAAGCGIDIVGNNFHDLPSSAIRADGNDVRVVSNRIWRCVLESDDQGAFDIYANPTFAGVEIRHNLWEDIGSGDIAHTGQAAVRLDDMISGVVIRDNRFVRCGRGLFGAVQINGGRRNFIDRNVFEDCSLDVSVQGRTDEKWKRVISRHTETFSSPLHLSRYPGLGALPDAPPANHVWRNTLIGVKRSAVPRADSRTSRMPVQ